MRAGGSVPCTIALLDGRIHFGLTAPEIERLASPGKPKEQLGANAEKIHKASVRDLGWILSTKASGATTVAATSFLAAKVGIRVFATGGIGGVHRDGHITMDVSADLVEMARSPIVVVCAGAKSILDIGRTLEYLETLGVAVIGYGTDEFPAFFTRKSGCAVPLRLDTPLAIAKLAKNSIELNVGRGVLVAAPISPKDEADAAVVEEATIKALAEAEAQKISGREITPFLLSRVSKLTGGHSLKANIALLEQNARIATQIAKEINFLEKSENPLSQPNVASKCPASSKVGSPSNCPFASKRQSPQQCPMKRANANSSCNPAESASSCPFGFGSSSSRPTSSVSEIRQWSYVKEGNAEPKVSFKREIVRPLTCTRTGQSVCKCPMKSGDSSTTFGASRPTQTQTVVRPAKDAVFVFGAAAVDVLAKPGAQGSNQESQLAGLSIPGEVTISAGGVGRNMAENLARFGLSVTLVTAIGTGPIAPNSNQQGRSNQYRPDYFGNFLIEDCKRKGIVFAPSLVPGESTAVYSALSYTDGKFRGGVAHMNIFSSLTPQVVARFENQMKNAKLIVVDANIPAATISYILSFAKRYGIQTFAEPTSAAKAVGMASIQNLEDISYLKPNFSELQAFAQTASPSQTTDVDTMLQNLIEKRGIGNIILTQGANSVKLASNRFGASGASSSHSSGTSQVKIVEFPVEESKKIVDVNGAGDSLAAGFIFGILSGLGQESALKLGMRAARLTAESPLSVSPLLGPSMLYEFAPRPASL